MDGYGQFCPIAKAAEVFDQRWTLLVLRELVAGSRRFNDIHRGVPRMSRTLLSKRLRQLASKGLVERIETADGPLYELTEAGHELHPVMDAIGKWGIRFMDSLTEQDVDPAFLMWDVQRNVDTDALPDGQTVVSLTFDDLEPAVRHWWLLLAADDVEMCDADPGYEIDIAIASPVRTFIDVWRGHLTWGSALRAGGMEITGPTRLRRQLPDWFRLSHFAGVER